MEKVKAGLVTMIKKLGTFRAKEINVPRRVLSELVASGVLEKSGRGMYRLATKEPSIHHSMTVASVRIPNGVISLLSALRFYQVGTQNPHEVWVTIPIRAHKPTIDYPALRIMRASGKSYSNYIRYHEIEGRKVPIYSLEKTIIDCFKYRNKIGVEVAIEALKDAWQKRKINIDMLWKAAIEARVANIIRPYFEAIQ